MSGNFFKSVPKGGDLHLISRVLFNWNDAQVLKILQQVRAAMPPEATLLIIEMFLPKTGAASAEIETSLNLLALTGALLRTEEQYTELLQRAGFRSPRLIPLANSEFNFLQALPA